MPLCFVCLFGRITRCRALPSQIFRQEVLVLLGLVQFLNFEARDLLLELVDELVAVEFDLGPFALGGASNLAVR